MARFYASIKGNRGTVSKLGTKESGISGDIRGWDLGVKVYGWVDDKGKDYFEVYRTSGSKGGKSDKLITIVRRI